MSLSITPTNSYSIHQFFAVLEDMDQNNETTNNIEMEIVRRQIEINLHNWTKSASRNQQRNQRIYRQKVMFLIMRFIELLQSTYNWEYSQQYFPFFDDEWSSFANWKPDYPNYTQYQIENDYNHFHIQRLQQREIELRQIIHNLIILCCCIAVAMFGTVCFYL